VIGVGGKIKTGIIKAGLGPETWQIMWQAECLNDTATERTTNPPADDENTS